MDKGPDSEFSIEPNELNRLCKDAYDAWLSLGSAGFTRQQSETESKVFRRSIYFVNDLPAGHIINEKDIRRIRPGMGLAPKYFDELIGKKLRSAVTKGTPTSLEYFSG
jgi:N-acetylneuraminate synthase